MRNCANRKASRFGGIALQVDIIVPDRIFSAYKGRGFSSGHTDIVGRVEGSKGLFMDYRTKVLAILILLAIGDGVIPIPIIGLNLIYVIIARPRRFFDLAAQIYGRAERGN